MQQRPTRFPLDDQSVFCNLFPCFLCHPQKHIKTHALVLLRSILGNFFLAAYICISSFARWFNRQKKTCSIAAKPPFFIRVIHSDTPGQISGDHLATSGVCKICKSRHPPRQIDPGKWSSAPEALLQYNIPSGYLT